MRTPRHLIAVIALIAGLVPIAVTAAGAVTCPTAPEPAALTFNDPVFVDRNRAGGEPVTIAAQDGSLSLSAHAGTTHIYKEPGALDAPGDFTGGYTNQTLNWRSTDGGKTWSYVGLAGTGAGPHSLTSTGFSDPDYAMDAGGRIYNTEIDLANVAVFSSNDDGQSYLLANPEVTSGDRPWVTGGSEDEVFLYVNTGKQILRSTDAGITWSLQSINSASAPNAKIYNDPRNFATGLIGPHKSGSTLSGISISSDEGKTWKAHDGLVLGPTVDFFGAIATDTAGHAYAAAAGGYAGPGDSNGNGQVTFNYFDRDMEEWQEEPITIPTPAGGDALWPWIVAGDDGRVAVAWLQSLPGAPQQFHVYTAITANGHGTTVACSDGTTIVQPPVFSVADATGRPVHKGPICLNGTNCNASTNFPNGDRRMGDFVTVQFDLAGNLMVATGDTTLKAADGGPKPVGNPLFVMQSGGERMRVTPITPRATRPLCLSPLCM